MTDERNIPILRLPRRYTWPIIGYFYRRKLRRLLRELSLSAISDAVIIPIEKLEGTEMGLRTCEVNQDD